MIQQSDVNAAVDVLEDLEVQGISVRAEAGTLQVSGPVGTLDGERRTRLAELKPAILQVLAREQENIRVAADERGRYDPFPLTGIQQGFLVGEQPGFYAEARPAVSVFEYAVDDLDITRVRRTLRTLTTARDALRLAVSEDGTQRYLAPNGDDELLEVVDLSENAGEEVEEHVEVLRAGLSRRLRPLEDGRPFQVTAVRLPHGYRLQIAVRLIAFDFTTLHAFLAEFRRCYDSAHYRPAPQTITHRDYVAWLEARKNGLAHRRARRYWLPKLEQIPEPPALPRPPAAAETETGFGMTAARLSQEEWEAFQKNALERNLPVVPAVVAVFAESLHLWSEHRRNHITLVVSNRAASYEDLGEAWGNFNTSVLLETGAPEGVLTIRARALQTEMHAHLDHLDVSGVDLVRQLQRARPNARSSPVAVTAVLQPQAQKEDAGPLPGARLVFQRTMPSLVELSYDMHVTSDGGLSCTAFYSVQAYPEGMIDSLMAHHEDRLRKYAADPRAWEEPPEAVLPAPMRDERQKANDTGQPVPVDLLHVPFEQTAKRVGGDVAILAGERSITYAELEETCARIADELAAQGLGPGDLAGIILPRGLEYVATILAVHRLGAAYLPLDPSWPADRVATILRQSGARVIVCDLGGLAEYAESAPCKCVVLRNSTGTPTHRTPTAVDLASPAYVIFTSGSTGTPKGVVISHRAAANTIVALRELLEISRADRVLTLSAPTFDLSVFDVFASLGTGASLVFPPDGPSPDPAGWAHTIHTHKVTVWNTVPALMTLLLDHLGERARETLASLRIIMLSGDWVPASLIRQLRTACPDARVIALGGATEAAIWSNWYDTSDLAEDWTHAPYGYPLPNQNLHVLDARLNDAPTWVAGDLYISGDGLADGYLNDPDRTAESFIRHPRTGVRMYRTGDRARYRPGGLVEFLGRTDLQVKIGGHRIELGDIDAHLMTHPAVEAAASTTVPGPAGAVLAAFVAAQGEAVTASVQAHLRRRLPAYMVPGIIRSIDRLPLTRNGKVDRAALREMAAAPDEAAPSDGVDTPAGFTVMRLREVWAEIFGAAPSDTSDFFAAGGNSLTALRLFRRISEVFGVEPRLSEIFSARTIRTQARLIDSRREPTDGLIVPIRAEAAERVLLLVHPIGGHVVCYSDLAGRISQLAPGTAVYGIRAPGLNPDEALSNSIAEQARLYAAEIIRLMRGLLAPARELHVAGWSMGGTIALEMARLLEESGTPVRSLTLLDSYTGDPDGTEADEAAAVASFFADLAYPSTLRVSVPAGTLRECLLATQQVLFDTGVLAFRLDADALERHYQLFRHHGRLLRAHRPSPWDGNTLHVTAARSRRDTFPGLLPIAEATGHRPDRSLCIEADHYSLILDDAAAQAAVAIAGLIRGGSSR